MSVAGGIAIELRVLRNGKSKDKTFSLLLNVFQSVNVKYPDADVVDGGIAIELRVLTNGKPKVKTFSLLLNVFQSVDFK